LGPRQRVRGLKAGTIRRATGRTDALLGRRVRELRLKAGLSLRALAQATDFSPSFVSQLEHGTVSPSLGSLERLVEVLGVALRDLFVREDRPLSPIMPRASRPRVTSAWSKARIEVLAGAGERLAALIIVLKPDGRSGKRPRAQVKEEFAFVLAGEVILTLGDKEHELKKGDSATLPAGTPRLWVNATTREARVLLVSAL
jgi:transcriptional regulator with XRE-family HTH domain